MNFCCSIRFWKMRAFWVLFLYWLEYVWLHINHSNLTRDKLISLLPKSLEESGSDNVLWGCPDNQASCILLLMINKVHCPCLVQDASSLNICFRQQEGRRGRKATRRLYLKALSVNHTKHFHSLLTEKLITWLYPVSGRCRICHLYSE